MTLIRNGIESADLDVPVVLPTLNLDFANSQNLDERITFSRGSIGTFVNKNGLIETAAANIPRFDYDPISGECRGLLIEESRANLISSSNGFGSDTTDYGITSGITSLDGTTNAVLMYEKTNNGYHFLTLTPTLVVSTTYCASIFCKYAGSKYRFRLKFGDGLGAQNNIIIDLRTGSIISGSGVSNSYGVIKYPNGWYRVYTTLTATSTSGFLQPFLTRDSDGSSIYQGDGSSGFYIYGAQVEPGTFPTSYIPTTASTVTRSADLASMTGTNFSSWYNQTEGTLYARWSYPFTPSGFPGITNLRDSASQNSISITTNLFNHNRFGASGSNVSIFDVQGANAVRANIPSSSVITYNTNSLRTDISYSGDGSIARLTKNIPIVNIDRLVFGNNLFNILSGHIRRVTYYPRALSPAQLQYITS